MKIHNVRGLGIVIKCGESCVAVLTGNLTFKGAINITQHPKKNKADCTDIHVKTKLQIEKSVCVMPCQTDRKKERGK